MIGSLMVIKNSTIKCLIFTLAILLSFNLKAENNIFGLSLGQDTLVTVKNILKIEYIGKTDTEHNFCGVHGEYYDVSLDQVKFDGLTVLRLFFDEKGILDVLGARFDKSKYPFLLKVLNDKYQAVSNVDRDLFIKTHEYINKDGDHISLVFFHNKDTQVLYKSSNLMQHCIRLEEQKQTEQQQREAREAEQL